MKKGKAGFTRCGGGVLYWGASKGNKFIETENSYSLGIQADAYMEDEYYEKSEQDHSTGCCRYYLLYFTDDGYGI